VTLTISGGRFMIERNVGARDRALRLSAAVALLFAGTVTLALRADLVSLMPLAVGLLALTTAITQHSPLYGALGMSTLRLTRVSSSRGGRNHA
jgi:hypothetical protein